MGRLYRYENEGQSDQGGKLRTYAGQYMGEIMEDEGGRYAMYDDGEGNKFKVYFDEEEELTTRDPMGSRREAKVGD